MRRFASVVDILVFVATLSALPSVAECNVDPQIKMLTSAEVHADVTILDAEITNTATVGEVSVLVNDAEVYAVSPKAEYLHVRVAIKLKTGDNLIAIAYHCRGEDMDAPSSRWTTHIYRAPDGAAIRHVVLIDGRSNSPTDGADRLSQLQEKLSLTGVSNFYHFGLHSSEDEISDKLQSIGRYSGNADQVLIYYTGDMQWAYSLTGPILLLGSAGIPLRDFLTDVANAKLPSVSLVFDVVTIAPSLDTGQLSTDSRLTSTLTANTTSASAWLEPLFTQRHANLIMSSRLGSSANMPAGELTSYLLSALDSIPVTSGSCATVRSLIRHLDDTQSADLRLLRRQAILSFHSDDEDDFCFNRVENVGLDLHISKNVIYLSTTLPAAPPGAAIDVVIDSTLVRHYGNINSADTNRFHDVIPISRGKHYVEVQLLDHSRIIFVAQGVCGTSDASVRWEREATDVRLSLRRPVNYQLTGGRQKRDIERLSTSSTYYAPNATLFTSVPSVADCEIRNNGVVVISQSSPTFGGEVAYQLDVIPLDIGINRITVQVRVGQSYREKKLIIERRATTNIKAVLVGVNSSPAIQSLQVGARSSDVERMRDMLLRFTDVLPRNISVLTDENATRLEVLRALEGASPGLADGRFPDPDILFFYFSGYGLTLQQSEKPGATRCILPYDASASNLDQTCVATTEIDKALTAWRRSVVVFDTSYDGISGFIQDSGNSDSLRSRTETTHFASDVTWRSKSGTDQPNRIFVVAGGTNSPALENTREGYGLFTYALTQSVKRLLTPSSAPQPGNNELPLYDAFTLARDETVDLSGNREVPLIKGSLDGLFAFSWKDSADLLLAADATIQVLRSNEWAMGKMDLESLDGAIALLEKALALDSRNARIHLALASAYILANRFDSAESEINRARKVFRVEDLAGDETQGLSLLLESELLQRKGSLGDAIDSCTRALDIPAFRLKATYCLAMLYAETGRYKESLGQFDILFNGFSDRPSLSDVAGDNPVEVLTENQWGRAIIWYYIVSQRVENATNRVKLLRDYAQSNSAAASIWTATPLGGLRRILPRNKSGPDLPHQASRSWTQLVAMYLVQPADYDSQLGSFPSERRSMTTVIDSESFNCMLHFYRGMQAIIDLNLPLARSEFQDVRDSGQTQFPEFWVAKAELEAHD